jgi:hypothetical protein
VAGMILVRDERGGVWMTSLGSWTVQTPFGSIDNVVRRQLVGDSEALSRGVRQKRGRHVGKQRQWT